MTRGKVWFLGGLAAGFVLGARAGRGRYDELVQAARKVKDNPTVQEAAGVVQERATRLYTHGKTMVNDRLSNGRFAETGIARSLRSRCCGGSAARFDEPVSADSQAAGDPQVAIAETQPATTEV